MQAHVFDFLHAEVDVRADVKHSVEKCGKCAKHTFALRWDPSVMEGVQRPCFRISWMHPVHDIQYHWHSKCYSNRELGVNWGSATSSKISSGSPLQVFYNGAGMNRLTVALDDCVTEIVRNLGIREEDGTLECHIEIPLDATGKTDTYDVTLWLDETDCRYEDAIRAVAAWWEEKYPPMPVPEDAKRPMYSFWYSFHQQLEAKAVEEECVRAFNLNMKTVIVDDGWQTDDNSRGYAFCGDWEVAASKIPDMAAHVKAVHDLGMKYMLWYSVPYLGPKAKMAKQFEGKTLEYIGGKDKSTYTLDPRYPEVRKYLIDTYVTALKAWDLDGFKLDFIDSFRMAKDTPAFREGMDHAILEDAVHTLMVDVKNALTAVKPDVLIEFRQSYIGPVMREFGNMFRVVDCPYMTGTNRVGIIDLRLTSGNTAVHSDMLMWNVNDRIENAVCQIQNIIFGTMQLSVLLDRVPADHIRAIRFWTKFMEEEIDLLQNAPIHAEDPQMLYPLAWTEKDGRSVIGCYQANYVVPVKTGLDDVMVLNANSGNSLVLSFDDAAAWNLTVCDCTGEVIREERMKNAPLMRIDVPQSGFIRLKKA